MEIKKIWINFYETEGSRTIHEVMEQNVMDRCYMDKKFMYEVLGTNFWVNMICCLIEDEFFLKKVIFYLFINY